MDSQYILQVNSESSTYTTPHARLPLVLAQGAVVHSNSPTLLARIISYDSGNLDLTIMSSANVLPIVPDKVGSYHTPLPCIDLKASSSDLLCSSADNVGLRTSAPTPSTFSGFKLSTDM